jgi:radical SAM superfamily enzyme YgiQ (UPF0313 family)
MGRNMPAKVLLITSSFEEVSLLTASCDQESGTKLTDKSHYPLGIAYLHSYLESQGNDVRSLCLNHCSYEQCFETVVETIEEFSPEIIGLQILTPNRVSSYRLIEYIHEKHPNIQLVVGGIHSTIMYRQLIEKYPFLIAVLGEGELTFSELIETLHNENTDLTGIDGIAFYHNNSVVKTNQRRLIDNLDILPFPKHDLFFKAERSFGCFITTRGCPFACSFCSLDSISRRRVRCRSVKNVVDEIENMINKFPQMTTIWIHDDSFFLNNKRVIEFCDEITRRKIKKEFVCSGRMKPLSEELVGKLEQANFKKVLLGLESGNDEILKAAHKGITKEDAVNAFKLFSRSSIEVHVFLIVGLPGETLETVMETVNLVKKLQRIKYTYYPDIAALLTIYPGTEIFDIAKANGMIDNEFWLSEEATPIFTVENDGEQLFQFKEIYLNHLSMDRFLTKAGFGAQFTMLPYIMKYIFFDVEFSFKDVLNRFLKFILPESIYESLLKQYKKMGLTFAKQT